MKVAFPVLENKGLQSELFGHFGSAPGFVVVDTATDEVTAVRNGDGTQGHRGGAAVAVLAGQQVEAVIVGGIGGGALSKLGTAGIRVFQAREATVAGNLALLLKDELAEYQGAEECGGHGHHHSGHGHGCSH